MCCGPTYCFESSFLLAKWLWRHFLRHFGLTNPCYWAFFDWGVRLPGKQTSGHRHVLCPSMTVFLLMYCLKKSTKPQNDWAQCFYTTLFLAVWKSFSINNKIILWQWTENISLPRQGEEAFFLFFFFFSFFLTISQKVYSKKIVTEVKSSDFYICLKHTALLPAFFRILTHLLP